MVTAVTFFSGSGAQGGTASSQAVPSIAFSVFAPRATSIGNRVGFFGLGGAPSSPIVVGQYNDRTHVVDHLGVNFGILINAKYIDTDTAEVSGVSTDVTGAGLEDIPGESGTVLGRFTEPAGQLVQTQTATFRAVQLTAASGVPDISDGPSNVNIYAIQLEDTHGNAGNANWTQIAGGGSNSLSLNDQAGETTIHDFLICVTASPTAAGRKIDFGFVFNLEFL